MAGWPSGPGQLLVTCEQGHGQRLGERDVRRVVDGHVFAKFPAAVEQGPVRCPLQRQCCQVSERQRGTASVHDAFPHLPPPDRRSLEIYQLRRGQPFPAQAATCVIAIVTVVGEGDGHDAGINDDHGRRGASIPRS